MYDPENNAFEDTHEGFYPQPIEEDEDLFLEDQSDFEEDEDFEEEYFDDSMDGDHESGLASAGWGTDEDYGDYGLYSDDGDF